MTADRAGRPGTLPADSVGLLELLSDRLTMDTAGPKLPLLLLLLLLRVGDPDPLLMAGWAPIMLLMLLVMGSEPMRRNPVC